jgi:glutamate/tyrosine decarboxylase-like PLP-dependent enzyme
MFPSTPSCQWNGSQYRVPGYVVSSGSDANRIALYLMKKYHPQGKYIVTTVHCHDSVLFAAAQLGLKVIQLSVDIASYQVNQDSSLHHILSLHKDEIV